MASVTPKQAQPIKIGFRVEAVREIRKIPRPKLAADLGIDRSTVPIVAHFVTAPRDLNATAAALGVEPSAFFAPEITRRLTSRRAA